LQELVNIISKKASETENLDLSIFRNAVFLNVTYGNRTAASDYDVDIGAEVSLAIRILFFYFVHGNKILSYTDFRNTVVKKNARNLRLSLVLKTIYESKRRQDKNIDKFAIIVGIDEVNKLHDISHVKFRDLVAAVGSISCSLEKVFFVPILAGTIEGPLQLIITDSMHLPLQLPLYLLGINDMLKIAYDIGFDKDYVYKNDLFRCIVSDIGGQVRALEIFYDQISRESKKCGFDEIDLVKIMQLLERELNDRYRFSNYSSMAIPMLANAILEIPVKKDEICSLPLEDNKIECSELKMTYKSLKSYGILTLEPVDNIQSTFYIRLPYLWVRLLINHSQNNSIFKFWEVMINSSVQFYWQQWEIFNIKFWALCMCLFSALGYEKITLKELLKGAKYSKNLDVDVDVNIPEYNHVCTHYLNNRYPSGDDHNMLDTESESCNVSSYDNSRIYKNRGGAESDRFCFLIMKDKPMLLAFQMKW
jgi:hypothetical protein